MLLHLGRASFLAAAQMCFCPLKRKSPLKPAKFFIDYNKDGENFQNPSSRTIKTTRDYDPHRVMSPSVQAVAGIRRLRLPSPTDFSYLEPQEFKD
jgi:hypothetical protein